MLRIIKKSIAWSLAVVILFTVSPVFADNEAKSGKSEINDISRSWAKSMIEKLSQKQDKGEICYAHHHFLSNR